MTQTRQRSLTGSYAGARAPGTRKTHPCGRCGVTIKDEYGNRRKRQEFCLDCRQVDRTMTRGLA